MKTQKVIMLTFVGMKTLFFILMTGIVGHSLFAQKTTAIYDSGGTLTPEQAAYDVTHYTLSLEVFPESRSIAGSLTASVQVNTPMRYLVLDLDTLLQVDSTLFHQANEVHRLDFERKSGTLWIDTQQNQSPGTELRVEVFYHGKPLQAVIRHRSWSDGFHWDTTATGATWLGVVSVLNGADIWWPCKDHPSDEPDSMSLNITVPDDLFVASNGKLRGISRSEKRKHTFHWFVSTPINNYDVTINVAPYVTLVGHYPSVSGDTIDVFFYVLPEHYQQGLKLFPQFFQQLNFYERKLGPYPFRADKYGVAETPFFGMENQSIISYGNNFSNNEYGFDGLHFHELAHEWFANLVTAPDWKDWWIHEGFATYLEALYVEELAGIEAYHEYVSRFSRRFSNRLPVAPRTPQTSREIYNGDIYSKGAAILHTLRYLLGEEVVFQAMRQTCYADAQAKSISDGSHCHFTTTDEFRAILEELSGQSLSWFFDVYLHQPELPQLQVKREGEQVEICWKSPVGKNFPMPVEVSIDGNLRRLNMTERCETFQVSAEKKVVVDPGHWLLVAEP